MRFILVVCFTVTFGELLYVDIFYKSSFRLSTAGIDESLSETNFHP